MLHSLTVGHLDPDAIRDRKAIALRPLDPSVVNRVLGEFPGLKVECRDGYVVVPWHNRGPTGPSEAFALRLQRETGCLIADRGHARIVEPSQLKGFAGSEPVARTA